jgi:hypothetical protein
VMVPVLELVSRSLEFTMAAHIGLGDHPTKKRLKCAFSTPGAMKKADCLASSAASMCAR